MQRPAPPSPTMTPAAWTLLLVLSALWGGSFLFNALALRELPVLTVVAARVGIAAVALLVVLRLSGGGLPGRPAAWRAFRPTVCRMRSSRSRRCCHGSSSRLR